MRRTRAIAELQLPAIANDATVAAQAAGLRYVSDARPGIRRLRSGRGFRYIGPDKIAVKDAKTLERIKSLVIPPAWTDVWISPLENGHLQATGRDVRGRKQSRYHPRWREVRDEAKYERLAVFAKSLPRIRRRVSHDLRLPGIARPKVLATIVRLLETTFIRVGNEEYVKQNGSYGLTTMRNGHAKVRGDTIQFSFKGKSGKEHCVEISDPRAARVVRRCQDLPGQELFQYSDENGEPHDVSSTDVNDYLREITGQEFTAKDFRTWAGTLLASQFLSQYEAHSTEAQAKRAIVQTVKAVAEKLGNTPAVCRKAYIHPGVLEASLEGSLLRSLQTRPKQWARSCNGLRNGEAALFMFLSSKQLRNHCKSA
jgi:DNA topoisomerase-1